MEILTKKNFIIALIFIININYISSNTGICKTIDNCLRCPNENRCLICKFGYRMNEDRSKCIKRSKITNPVETSSNGTKPKKLTDFFENMRNLNKTSTKIIKSLNYKNKTSETSETSNKSFISSNKGSTSSNKASASTDKDSTPSTKASALKPQLRQIRPQLHQIKLLLHQIKLLLHQIKFLLLLIKPRL